jgi:alcohol dehydrogenase
MSSGWRLPTRVFVQPGGIADALPALAASLGRRAALVTDAGLEGTPWPSRVEASLRAAGVSLALRFTGVEPNPRTSTADTLAAAVRASGAEFVIGLGGGSAIDAAKAAAMLARNDGPATAFEGKNKFTQRPLPLLAVPTTCGTGSEVTWVSVLTHAAQQRKISVKGDAMFPAIALVDAHVLRTLPRPLVAYTGVDALTHAVEATLCRHGVANDVSDALAEDAIAALFAHLRAACAAAGASGGGGEEGEAARAGVMRASTLAGMAFGNADVGAVHCLSESIGGVWDVPHGLGNAVFLGATLRHHLAVEDMAARSGGSGGAARRVRSRLSRLAARVTADAPHAMHRAERGSSSSGGGSAEAFLDAVDALVRDLRVPPFSSLNISKAEHPRIAALAVANGSNGSNPGDMGAADYLRIMQLAG